MQRLSRQAHRGFTLIEIMIVVAIISVLLAIAVPNFTRARERSRTKRCIANLKVIESAKEQWALDTRASGTAWVNLTGSGGLVPRYIKTPPTCPSGGTYNEMPLSDRPQCSVGWNGTAGDTRDDHALQ
jgi:prepilin-type N-terminal cleavage/methylation domain-containing protein